MYLLRHAYRVGPRLGASLVFVVAMTATGQLLAQETSGQPVLGQEYGIWLMAALTGLGLVSLFKYTFGAIPALLRRGYEIARDGVISLLLIAAIGAIFLLA